MKLRIGHSINNLFLTTNWIYNQLVTMRKYEPITVTRQIKGNTFPLKHLYCFQDLKGLKRLAFRVLRKLTGVEYEYYVLRKNRVVLLHSHFDNSLALYGRV